MTGKARQQALISFLQAELYHSLGSYSVARASFEAQNNASTSPSPRSSETPAQQSAELNKRLSDGLHLPAHLKPNAELSIFQVPPGADLSSHAAMPPQHPSPFPRSTPTSLSINPHWVVDYYDSAVSALESVEDPQEGAEPSNSEKLGSYLAVIHDAQRLGKPITGDHALLKGRLSRNKIRLQEAEALLGCEPQGEFEAAQILHSTLDRTGSDTLHEQVIAALVDSHSRMHHVEHLRSHSFGDKITHHAEIERATDEYLKQSILLNTFAYVIGRSVPWIFAADDAEREFVLSDFAENCHTLTPTNCMWLAGQVYLLALHRRAYSWWLLRNYETAYKDFHKLKRYIAGLESRLTRRIIAASNADVFLRALSATAEHHMGEIYRSQHAHTAALRHYRRSHRRLDWLADNPASREAVRNSRWRINLLISRGKANYELGCLKHSLLCYVRAWKSFLELAETESNTTANLTVVSKALDWLERVKDEPELNKVALVAELTPVVDQFAVVHEPAHLRLLAAEIIMHLGHLIFILNPPEHPIVSGAVPRGDCTLAYRCVCQAIGLDNSSTISATDILKVRHRSADSEAFCPLPSELSPPAPPPIREQWPSGGSEFEEMARVVEYVLHRWLDTGEVNHARSEKGTVAKELLSSLLAHTDSTNVKLAQVYRYLMQDSSHADLKPSEPTLDLVCMRRYSSFFPFVPRPSAFRVLGGGYFIHAHEPKSEPFGIAVDPGPNFIENLYRCGYCLDDIHMVIVTHDHADHMASLDALLSLLYYRLKLGVKTFSKERRLLIVGNDSVVNRYGFFNNPSRGDCAAVWSFDQLDRYTRGEPDEDLPGLPILAPPSSLRITPIESTEHTDAEEHLAMGFLISIGKEADRSSILFTSDTGVPAGMERGSKAACPLLDAVKEASVVVAHISSVPLPELRELAGLGNLVPQKARELTQEMEELWEQLYEQSQSGALAQQRDFLIRQLHFGFHIRPKDDSRGISPLGSTEAMKGQSEKHLYLSGLVGLAKHIADEAQQKLLIVGELHEELGTFRTRVAMQLNRAYFEHKERESPSRAFTADIGLKLRLRKGDIKVLCTTCDLDNDLVDAERFHAAREIREVCVKGDDEGVFYNCLYHDPKGQEEHTWLERIERYDPFGHNGSLG